MMPFVEEEFETIRTIIMKKASIARFGDGELRNALDGGCKCQSAHPQLASMLRKVLKNNLPSLLVGIPRSHGRADLWRWDSKKAESWSRYERDKFSNLYDINKKYYSSFITRPDSAFHIDCEDYWRLIKSIWNNRKVFIATGGKWKQNDGLFDNTFNMEYCNNFPSAHAFSEYNQILERLLQIPKDTLIILSLGPVATVLAYDLTTYGYQALDLGHLEMFYRRGRFRVTDLFSKKDIKKDEEDIGYKWKNIVKYLIEQWKCNSVLDYGCGNGTLGVSINNLGMQIHEYDPGIKGKTICPSAPYDLVVCSNVLHLIDHSKIENVLDHLNFLVGKVGLFIIPSSEEKGYFVSKIEENRKWKSVSIFPLNDNKYFGILVTK